MNRSKSHSMFFSFLPDFLRLGLYLSLIAPSASLGVRHFFTWFWWVIGIGLIRINFNMRCNGLLLIRSHHVVIFLIAAFAKAAGMVCPVVVTALGSLTGVAVLNVAEVAHEFSSVPLIMVSTNLHKIKCVWYAFKILQGVIRLIVLYIYSTIFLIYEVLKILHLLLSDSRHWWIRGQFNGLLLIMRLLFNLVLLLLRVLILLLQCFNRILTFL